MAVYVANDSILKIGATVIGEVREATITETVDSTEVVVINSTAKRFVASVVEGTMDLQFYLDAADTGQEQFKINQTITGVQLAPNGDGASEPTYTGDLLVTDVSISTAGGGIVEKNVSGRITGNLVQA